MSSGPDTPPSPAGRGPSQTDDGIQSDKGDNCGESQLELQRSDGRSGNPTNQKTSRHIAHFTFGRSDQIVNMTTANQKRSSKVDEEHSDTKHFAQGKPDPAGDRYDGLSGVCRYKSGDPLENLGGSTSPGVDSYIRGGGSPAGDVVTTAMVSLEATPERPPRKRDKKTSPDFKNIDYSGHFKINIISRDTPNKKVLTMKIEEVMFVKFCHLFSCDVELCVVKEALQFDLKLDVTKGEYPPTIRTQPGGSDPIYVIMKRLLSSLCYQLSVVNISSTPWNIDQVKTILSSVASYQEGIVIGYEVSGDMDTNYWLVGERASMKSVIEILSMNLGPRGVSVQQSSQNQNTEHRLRLDRDTTSSGDESSSNDQQERFRQPDNRVPLPGSAVSAAQKQLGTEEKTERTSSDHQTTRQEILNQEHHSNMEQESTHSLRGKPGGIGSKSRHTDQRGSGDRNENITQPSKGEQQDRIDNNAGPSKKGGEKLMGDPTGFSLEGQQECIGDSSQQFTAGLQKGIHYPSESTTGDRHEGSSNQRPMASRPTTVGRREGMVGTTQHQQSTGHQPYLSDWSRQDDNSPPRGSASAPMGQLIGRSHGQGQTNVHGGPGSISTRGQNLLPHTKSEPSPSRDGHYRQHREVLPANDDEHQEAETTFFTNKIKLCRLEESILSCLPLLEDLRNKFPQLRIQWEKGRHAVFVTGNEVDVSRVASEIHNYLKAVKDNKVEIHCERMEQEALNMFNECSVLDFVTDNVRSHKVACYLTWNEDSDGVYLCIYADDTDMDKAVQFVTSSIVCRKIKMDSDWELFLDSKYVLQELTDLKKKYNGKVTITLQKNAVTLTCTTDIEDLVLTTVNRMKEDFFTEGTKTVNYTPHGDLTVELCTKVLQDDIQMIEEKFGVQCQSVKNYGKHGWTVKGPKGTLEKACDILKDYCARVTSNQLQVQDKTAKDFFKTQSGQDYMASVCENTKCLVTCLEQEVPVTQETVEGVRSGRQGPAPGTERSERGSNMAGRQWRSADGLGVALYCGDGRKSTSDVLVHLTQNEGDQRVTFHSYQDKVTVSLNLPEWRDGEKQEKDKIRKSFEGIIIEALKKRYTSLTILLDDCKQCGWKERKAYKLFVKNTLFVLWNRKDCSCAYYVRDQAMFMALRDVIDDSFGSDGTVKTTDDEDEISLDWEHVDQTCTRGQKLKIVVHKGEIAKMTSEVIVNTTDAQLKLDVGAVSASILREAGPLIQTECDQYYNGGVKFGDVAITHGYRLKCKHVFHGALPTYSKDHQCKCLKSYVLRCLTEADKKKHSTITFPALGTGNLGYPRDLVAKTMFDTVNNYFKDVKDSSIERVSFVVYPKDIQTVKAFEAEEERQKLKGEEPSGATGGPQTGSMTRETNAWRKSDEISTKKMYLVVAGKLEDYIEKAIQPLQNKLRDLQKQQPPRSYLHKENGGTKLSIEKTGAQSDQSFSPAGGSTTVEKSEYEAKRLVLKPKTSSGLEKATMDGWLKRNGFDDFTVVCPFIQDMEALVIFQSVNDAQKLMRQQNNVYDVKKFPSQILKVLKAPLKTALVETVKKCVKPEEIFNASGAKWSEENGTCFLKGSLVEIQCATIYISKTIDEYIVTRQNSPGAEQKCLTTIGRKKETYY